MITRVPIQVGSALNEPLIKRRATGSAGAGLYLFNGDPESQVTADPGSIGCDMANGRIYLKTSGVANLGWNELVLKTSVYTKAEVNALLSEINGGTA